MLGTWGPRQRSFQTVSPSRFDVVVDRQLAGADLDSGAVSGFLAATLEADELELERLGGELGARFLVGDDPADEPLALPHDARHLLVDRLEVVGAERLLDAEVVVEAVGDRRADAEVRLRVDPLDGLRQHMRGRMAQDAETIGAVDRDRFDGIRRGDCRREVFQLAVHAQRDDGSIGEQGESVGGIGHIRRDGGVSQGTLQKLARTPGYPPPGPRVCRSPAGRL